MANVQTCEVGVKFAAVNVAPWKVKFGNHGNHTILVWQLNPYFATEFSTVEPHCLTRLTMIIDVTMESKLRAFCHSLTTDAVLLNV
jgi:hypothetical protein